MANSILKKHQLDITVGVELNDAQRKATSAQIKNMANQWQDMLDDAIKKGIEDGARSASLKDVLTQFNAQLKAFKLEPLTITVDELQIMDKPIEHAAKLVIQKLGDSFKGGGLGNIISSEITDSLDTLGGTVDKIYQKMEQGAKKSAQNISKSMQEIATAAEKYSKKASMQEIDKAIRSGVKKDKAEQNVTGFLKESTSARKRGASWDEQYLADVKFVKNYEKVAEGGADALKRVFGNQFEQVEQYYNNLAKVHQQKIIALNDILAQNEFVGGTKKTPVQYQFKGGEPWAREKTLQEVKSILSGGLTVKDDSSKKNDTTPDPNINTKKPQKTAQPNLTTYGALRAVENKGVISRDRSVRDWGGEYWSAGAEEIVRKMSQSYADNFYKDGAVIKAEIQPINPLVFDAEGFEWNAFDKIPGIKELFPGIVDLMKKPGYIDDDGQKYINDQAKAAGFDSVVIKNVNDFFDSRQEGSDGELASVISVLNDNIIKYIGSFEIQQGDKGAVISDKLGDIPDFYSMPEEQSIDQKILQLRQQQEAYEQWYKSTVERLSTDAANEEIVKSLQKQHDITMANFNASIEQAGVKEQSVNESLVEEKKITQEIEKQNKLLLYRRGKTSWNPEKFRNSDMLGNSVWMGNEYNENTMQTLGYNGAVPSEYGGFGDGLFASTITGASDLSTELSDGESYFEIDASKYKMYINETEEQAERMKDFLLTLQKFVLAAGDFRGFDGELENVNEQSLFTEASSIFEAFNMSQEEFAAWLRSMKQIVTDHGLDAKGVWTKNVDDKFLNSHNFGTRFMQQMGYEGVVNYTGNEDFDGNAEGSVIFDPDFDELQKHIESSQRKWMDNGGYEAFIERETQAIREETAAYIEQSKAIDVNTEAKKKNNNVDSESSNTKPGKSKTTTSITDSKVDSTSQPDVSATISDADSTVLANLNTTLTNLTAALGQEKSDPTATINTEELGSVLHDGRPYLVDINEKSEDVDSSKVSIDTEGLQSVLTAIIFKVQDISEKEPASSAIDQESINSLVGAIKTAITPQSDGDNKNSGPWAKEETLRNITGSILGKIANSIPKVDTKGLAKNDVLNRVAQATEAINNKISGRISGDISKSGKANQSTLFDAKVEKQLSQLNLYETQLAAKNKLTPEISREISTLKDGLYDKDNLDLSLWSQQAQAVLNSVKETLAVTDMEAKETKDSIAEIVTVTKQYNDAMVRAEKTDNTELKAFWHNKANEALGQQKALLWEVEQTTGEVVDLTKLELDLETKLGAIRAEKAGKAKAEQDKAKAKAQADAQAAAVKKEAEAVEQLKTDYIELGRLRAQRDAMEKGSTERAALSQDIKARSGKLGRQSAKLGVDSTAMKDLENDARTEEAAAIATRKHKEEYDKLIEKIKERNKEQEKLAGADKDSKFAKDVQARVDGMNNEIDLIQQKIKLTKEEQVEVDKLNKKRDNAVNDKSNKKQDQADAKKLREEIKEARKQNNLDVADSTYNSARKTMASLWQLDSSIDPASIPEVQALQSEMQKLDATYKQVNEKVRAGQELSDEEVKDLNNTSDATAKKTAQLKELIKNYTELQNGEDIGQYVDGVGSEQEQLQKAINDRFGNKAKIKEYRQNADGTVTAVASVKTGTRAFTEYTVAVSQADQKIKMLTGTTKQVPGFLDSVKRKLGEISQYVSAMSVISRAGQELRKGIQYVRDIDLALTELKKVTDETEETYDKFLDTASKTAAKVGSTIRDVVSSTADFARIGYTLKEAALMAESAQILMNVSEFTDVNTATDTLISAVKAFGYTAEETMNVVDTLNIIGNNYAISTADLATSLTKSSASLVAAGGDLAEAAALTATANAIVQDADSVGTALKTTSLRLRGTDVKTLEEEGVDSEGAVTSKSKLQSKVKALSGVDILTESGDYKSTYQILSQIADVWEDINNMDQAALLELLAGKRNASTLAAILQAPEELKAAYEDAQNAEGSALKENEKYMDSIQGKIDQFNNALQTMWANLLGDDVVKFFVDLGRQLVVLLDKIGPLNALFIGFGVFAAKKYNLFDSLFGEPDSIEKSIEKLQQQRAKLDGLTGTNAANERDKIDLQIKEKQAILDQKRAAAANAAATAETKDAAATSVGETADRAAADATTQKTATTWADVWAEMTRTGATGASVAATLKQVLATKLANSALVQKGLAIMGVTAAELTNIPVTTLLAGGFVGLASSIWSVITAMWTFMTTTPIGWILMAVGAVVALGAAFAGIHKSTAELKEKLEGLNSEIDSLKTELDSLNSELETTQDRMNELLAKDTLSLVEQDELKNLKLQNELLEKQIELQELAIENKKKERQGTAQDVIEKTWSNNSYGKEDYQVDWDDGVVKKDNFWSFGRSGKEAIDAGLKRLEQTNMNADIYESAYKLALEKYDPNTLFGNWIIESNKKNYEEAQELITKQEGGIAMVLSEMSDIITENELRYGQSDEIDKFLDEYYTYSYKLQQAQGRSVNSQVIGDLFDATSSDQLLADEEYINSVMADKALDWDQKNAKIASYIDNLDETSEGYSRLNTAMEEFGITSQDIADYFTTGQGDATEFAVDAKINEIEKVGNTFEQLLNDQKFTIDGANIGLSDLFDEEGKIAQDKLSQIFKGTSEQTREDITSILENSYDDIKNGTADINNLLSQFALQSNQQILEISRNLLIETNKEIFPNMEDEISGIIDTFDELAAAVGSVVDAMDALEQARKEEAHSGSVSIETLLNLMQYTDDYAKIVSIDETGAIHLAADAQNILIQEKINAIKTNAEQAYQEALVTYEMAVQAKTAGEAGNAIYDGYITVIDEAAGALSYVGSIAGDVWKAIKGEGWVGWSNVLSNASNARNSTIKSKQTKRANSVSDAEAALKKAEDNRNIANALTPENVRTKYSADEASGENDSGSDGESAFEKMQARHEREIAALEHQQELIQGDIDILEAQRKGVSSDYYKKLIAGENSKIDAYERQLAEAKELLAATSDTDEEYNDIVEHIWDIEKGLQDAAVAAIEFGEALNANHLKGITDLGDAYDNLYNINDRQKGSLELYKDGVEIGGGFVNERWYDDMIAKAGEAGELARQELNDSLWAIDQYRNQKNPFEVGTAEYEGWEFDRNKNLQEAWGQAADAKDKIQEAENEALQLAEDKKDAYIEAWENVATGFERIGTLFENQISLIDGYESRLEALNINIPDEVYQKKINAQQSIVDNLDEQIAYDEKMLIEYASKYGTNDERYISKWEELNDKRVQRYEAETQIIETEQQIIDNQIDRFNQTIDRMNDAVDKMNNIKSLVSDEDVADENGNWTAEGLTQAGMNFQEMAYQKEMIAAYADQMEELTELYEDGKISEKEYYEQMKELEDGQWSAIEAYKQMEDAIVDLAEARIDAIENGLQEEIDAYAELIELKKEELDAERDLFEFRRDVEDQSKNIAEIERRIASLSGSSSNEDRAEMKRLQKELSEANRGLDDTYRNHSYDQTSQALDEELEIFEKTYEDYIQGLRDELENTDELIKQVYADVVSNGQLVLETLVQLSDEHGFTLDTNLTTPWRNANGESLNFETAATEHYNNIKTTVELGTAGFVDNITKPWKRGQEESALFGTKAKSVVDQALLDAQNKQSEMSDTLKQPWLDAKGLIDQGPTWVSDAAYDILQVVKQNVKDINAEYAKVTGPSAQLSNNVTSGGGTGGGGTGGGGGGKTVGGTYNTAVADLQKILNQFFGAKLSVDGSYGPATKSAVKTMQEVLRKDSGSKAINVNGEYNSDTKIMLQTYLNKRNVGSWFRAQGIGIPAAFYAKGTLGTSKDGWAIDSEPQYGDELVLVPNAAGNLSFMRKGTGVVPADLTKRIMEIAQMPASELGNNMIKAFVPNIETTNQAVQVNFEALVKADNITNDVLPEVEKLVEKQLNTFTKNLNYSLKKVGGR